MKTKAFFQLAIYGLLFIGFGCEEKNDLINYKSEEFNTLKVDSTYNSSANDSAQKKNVLLEDFTAVRCVNCPRAQKEAKNIQALYPNRVIVSSIHVSDLADPYKESKENFKTVEGQNLLVYLGDFSSFPIGTIDRKIYSGNTKPFVYDIQWKSLVTQQLALQTPMNITFLSKEYNELDHTLKMKIKVTYTQDVNVANYISVFLNESNIIDLQLNTSGVDSNYVHNHALRTIMQPANGLKLGDNFQKGKTIIVSLTAKLLEKWKPENCHIAAFVHQRDNSFEVYHIEETEVNK
jgi:hypothetical protein